ncbi:MAG: Ig-like domain-containing protein [Odoribacteraceae bacterium]|jgi:uncharacterized protein YjdB|nr:Ig-like domain-containing protein [Odoribacteraceae bacterium]
MKNMIKIAMIAATCGILALTSCKDEKQEEDKPIAVQSVTTLPDSIAVRVDETRPVIVTVAPLGADQQVLWISADTAIATGGGGSVRGKAVGQTVITIASVFNREKFSTVHVTVSHALVQEITVDNPALSIVVGEAAFVSPSVLPVTAYQEVIWSVDDPTVATVSNGLITAIATGTATITITSAADPTKFTTVRVTVITTPVASVSVDLSTVTLFPGDTRTITPTVLPAEADQAITWTVDYPAVATVSNGVITAVGPGMATVTVSSATDPTKFDTVAVTVDTPGPSMVFASAYGIWDFDDPSDMEHATVGNDLVFVTVHPRTVNGTGAAITSIAGPSSSNKAITVPVVTYLQADHGIPANGGGNNVNIWSVMLDIRVPVFGRYYSLFQTEVAALTGANDADYFIRNNATGLLGGAGNNYSPGGELTLGQWHRVVIVTDNTLPYATARSTYVDGVFIFAGFSAASPLDSRHTLSTAGVLFFEDDSKEDNELDCAAIAIWGRALTSSEVQILGSPQ